MVINMEDKTLTARLLTSSLIINNFVQGEPDCNYEKYMLEFVNESAYFLTKSNGIRYTPPENESFGQCDCISVLYQMDFKLIASKTALQARSILSVGKVAIAKGVISTVAPKVTGGAIKATRIHAALRDYSFEMLFELREKAIKKQGVENDICELLETLETKKNLLLFFPYSFSFDNEYEFHNGIFQIQEAMSNDFQFAMQYRHNLANNFDTYMAFVYDRHIVFMEETNNHFNFIDSIELSKSHVYQELLGYGDMI